MNNLQILLSAYRLFSCLTPLKDKGLELNRKIALHNMKSLVLELVSEDAFIEFCSKLNDKD